MHTGHGLLADCGRIGREGIGPFVGWVQVESDNIFARGRDIFQTDFVLPDLTRQTLERRCWCLISLKTNHILHNFLLLGLLLLRGDVPVVLGKQNIDTRIGLDTELNGVVEAGLVLFDDCGDVVDAGGEFVDVRFESTDGEVELGDGRGEDADRRCCVDL